MPARYIAELYNTAGVKQAVFDDWNSLTLTHKLNSYSTHVLSFSQASASDPRLAYFTRDSIVRVLRQNLDASLPWYAEYTGFHRTPQRQIFSSGLRLFTSYGRGFEDLLRRAAIEWYSGSDESDKDAAAETVMKAYVNENMGPAALETNGRVRDHIVPSFSIAPDSGLGPNWIGSRAWRKLMDVLTEIADSSSIDFNVALTALTPPAFEFRTYYPRRGADRTQNNTAGNAPVTLSTSNGTMQAPSYTDSADEQVTQLTVMGQGQEEFRTVVVVGNAAATAESPWSDIEDTYSASFEEDDDALPSDGAAELIKRGAQEQFEFTVLQQPPLLYGRDYFLGDLVSIAFGDIVRNKKLVGVEIVIAEGKETIKPTFADVAL